MKIIIVGASGTIGKAVAEALKDHQLIHVARNSGQYQMDLEKEDQIAAMFEAVGAFDALIATTGKVHFAPLDSFHTRQWHAGLNNKLMGQVNLVMYGLKYIRQGGSFTLTSGILNQEVIEQGTSAAMVNSALEGFVTSAAIEMPQSVRINIVSPTVIQESLAQYGPYFKGYIPVSAAEAAAAYVKSVYGKQTGKIYRAGW